MKIAGIILLVLQAVALFGSVVNGSISTMFSISGGYAVGRLLGYFLPAIIGVILLVKANKKKK